MAIGLVLLLLAIAPFAVAQDVHHELAAADHDGHEHSDTDLCQWVQHHTAGSLDVGAPLLTAQELVDLLELPSDSVLLSFELSTPGPSRAPPLQLVTSFRFAPFWRRLSSDCLVAGHGVFLARDCRGGLHATHSMEPLSLVVSVCLCASLSGVCRSFRVVP